MGKYVFLLVLAHLLVLSLLPFTTWPEMLLYPWLTAKGFVQYKEIIHPYSFALIATLAGLGKIVGFSPLMVKLATYFIVVLSDFLLYRLALLFGAPAKAIAVLLLYILLQISFEGNALWFDLALTPFAILALHGTVQWVRNQKLRWVALASAALLGSLFVKQTGVWFVFAAAGVLVLHKQYRTAGFILFLLTLGFVLFSIGGYAIWGGEFLYWTLWFPLIDQKQTAGFVLLPSIREIVLAAMLLLPALFFALLKESRTRLLFLLWCVAGALSAVPRWGMFHLQPALPFVALVSIPAFTRVPRFLFLSMLIPALYVVYVVFGSARAGDRFVTKEVMTAAQMLQHEVKDTGLFILGAPQLLYVLSGHIPPRPWADLFPWYYQVRGGELETRVLYSLQSNPPAFVLRAPVTGDRPEYRYRPQQIERWVDENYREYKKTPSGTLWKKRE